MENTKEILLWLNGRKPDTIYSFTYNSTDMPTLPLFKESIHKVLKKDYIKLSTDNMCLYTQKGIEFEEGDLPYLYPHQILFVLKADEEFQSSNHYYQYNFIKWIKSGGYGQVFLAQHIITKEEYAIKQINTKSFSSQDLYNISREHVILQSLCHRNIIKCHHSYSHEDHFFTVMDNANGGELGKYIRGKGGVKEKEAKKIFKQIYNAVNYIHGKNMIHRDLKPNNILFLNKEQTEIVLIDFGISGFSNGNIKEKIYAGTTRFQPPEMASGTSFMSTPKIDVWALGIILYYMIYNSFPFDGKNDKEVNKAIVYDNVHFDPKVKVSDECRELIRDMLQKNQRFRIGMDSELFDKWFTKKDNQFSKNTYALSSKVIRNNIFKRHSLFPIKNDIRRYIDEFLQFNSIVNNNNNGNSNASNNNFNSPSTSNINKYSSSNNLINSSESRVIKRRISMPKLINLGSMVNLNLNIKLPLLPVNDNEKTIDNDNDRGKDYGVIRKTSKKELPQTSPRRIRRSSSFVPPVKKTKFINNGITSFNNSISIL